MKLRADCFGVKVRAEKGLENALDALTTFVRDSQREHPAAPSPEPPVQPPISVDTTTVSPDTVKGPRSERIPTAGEGNFAQSPRVHGRVDRGEGRPSAGNIFDEAPGGFGGDSGGVAISVCDVEDKLVLREMPNGLRVWCGSRAEEEAFFIYGEIFEDRTYARRGIRVEDGDTMWDVGETDAVQYTSQSGRWFDAQKGGASPLDPSVVRDGTTAVLSIVSGGALANCRLWTGSAMPNHVREKILLATTDT